LGINKHSGRRREEKELIKLYATGLLKARLDFKVRQLFNLYRSAELPK